MSIISSFSPEQKLFYILDCTRPLKNRLSIEAIAKLNISELKCDQKFENSSYLIVPEFLHALLIFKNTGISKRIPDGLTKEQQKVWEDIIELFCGLKGIPDTNFLSMIKIKILYDLVAMEMPLQPKELREILKDQKLSPYTQKAQEEIEKLEQEKLQDVLNRILYKGIVKGFLKINLYLREGVNNALKEAITCFEAAKKIEEKIFEKVNKDHLDTNLLSDSINLLDLILNSLQDKHRTTLFPYLLLPSMDDDLNKWIEPRTVNVIFALFSKCLVLLKRFGKDQIKKHQKLENHEMQSSINKIHKLGKSLEKMSSSFSDLENALGLLGYFGSFRLLFDQLHISYPVTKNVSAVAKASEAVKHLLNEYEILEKNIEDPSCKFKPSTITLYREIVQQQIPIFHYIEQQLDTEIKSPSERQLQQVKDLKAILSGHIYFLDSTKSFLDAFPLYLNSLLNTIDDTLGQNGRYNPISLLRRNLYSALFEIKYLLTFKGSREHFKIRESIRARILTAVRKCHEQLNSISTTIDEKLVNIPKPKVTVLQKLLTIIEESLKDSIYFLPNHPLTALLTPVSQLAPNSSQAGWPIWVDQIQRHFVLHEGLEPGRFLAFIQREKETTKDKAIIESLNSLEKPIESFLFEYGKERQQLVELFGKSSNRYDINLDKIWNPLDAIQKKFVYPQDILDWMDAEIPKNILKNNLFIAHHLKETYQFLQMQSILLFPDYTLLSKLKHGHDLLAEESKKPTKKKLSTSPPKTTEIDIPEIQLEEPPEKMIPLEEIPSQIEALLASPSLKNESIKETLHHLSYYMVLMKQFKLLANHPYLASLGELLYGGLSVEQTLKALSYQMSETTLREQGLVASHNLLKLSELFTGMEKEIPSFANKHTGDVLNGLQEVVSHLSRHIPSSSGEIYDPLNQLYTLSKSGKKEIDRIKKSRNAIEKDKNVLMMLVYEILEFIGIQHKVKRMEKGEEGAPFQFEISSFTKFTLKQQWTAKEGLARVKITLGIIKNLLVENKDTEGSTFLAPKQLLERLSSICFVLDEIDTVPSDTLYQAPLAMSILYAAKVSELLEGIFLLYLSIHQRSVLFKEYESTTQKRPFGYTHLITEFAAQIAEHSKGGFVLDDKKSFLNDLQFVLIKLNHYPYHKGESLGRLSQVFQAFYEFSSIQGKQNDIKTIMNDQIFAMGPFVMDIALQVLNLLLPKKK